jgi:hypothetical protein
MRCVVIAVLLAFVVSLYLLSPETVEAGKAWCRDCRGR